MVFISHVGKSNYIFFFFSDIQQMGSANTKEQERTLSDCHGVTRALSVDKAKLVHLGPVRLTR